MKKFLGKKLFYIYLLSLIGFLLIFYFIWFRFLRERMPRDIPFELSVFGFFLLCIICISYMYLLYRDCNVKKQSDILLFFLKYIIKIFKAYDIDYKNYIYIIFNIIPKIILIVVFILDIFYFKKVELFYKFLIIGFLPLFFLYMRYSISQYLIIIINKLNKYFYVKILSTKNQEENLEKNGKSFFCSLEHLTYINIDDDEDNTLDVNYFITLIQASLILNYTLYEYTCIETSLARDYYSRKYKIPLPAIWIYSPRSDEISKKAAQEFNKLMPQAYYFAAFLELYNNYTKLRFVKYEKYFLLMYLICWTYILFISIHTLNLLEFAKILKMININQDPFSGTELFKN